MIAPINVFAHLLMGRGVAPGLANAYGQAFRAADSPEKRERIIENLRLSHAMTAMAVYGDAMHGKDVSQHG